MIKLLKKLFRHKAMPATALNETFINQVEEAFEFEGKKYYRFKEDSRMPYGRYQVLETYLMEYELRMDHQLFKAYLNDLEKNLNGASGTIRLDKAFETLEKMKARAEMAFNPMQAYNIASVIYFDESENLYSYDGAINKQKVNSWKEARMIDFFYMRPMSELLGLNNFSKQDLEIYFKETLEMIGDLTENSTSDIRPL